MAENLFEEIMAKNFSNLRKNGHTNSRSSIHSNQDKSKKTYTKTHYNKTVKSHRQRESFESSNKKLLITYKEVLEICCTTLYL